MTKRKCALCAKPVQGHDGPTGARCRAANGAANGVTPLKIHLDAKETPGKAEKTGGASPKLKVGADYSTSESEHSGSEEETTEDVVKRVVHKKLKKFGNKIDKLASTVESLVTREVKRAATAVVSSTASVNPVIPEEAVPARVAVTSKGESEGATGGVAETSPKQTTASLAKNTEINALLSKYSESEREFLEVQEAINKDSLQSSGEKRKFLAIPDYVNLPDCFLSDDEETLLTTTCKHLTFKSKSNKKLEPREVSVAQWIGANSRILDILTPTLTRSEIADYNDYTRQVGDLLQLYTDPSVMSLDHAHRRAVSLFNRRWNDVSNHTERFYLRIRPSKKLEKSETSDAGKGARPKNRTKFQHVCVKYNTTEGCTYGSECRFRHKCNEKGCHDTRPKHTHEHFRSAGT
jgi:hypothetical protein